MKTIRLIVMFFIICMLGACTAEELAGPESGVEDDGLSGNFWLVSFKISYLCLPLFYETQTTPSCHPSGCAYRQL